MFVFSYSQGFIVWHNLIRVVKHKCYVRYLVLLVYFIIYYLLLLFLLIFLFYVFIGNFGGSFSSSGRCYAGT